MPKRIALLTVFSIVSLFIAPFVLSYSGTNAPSWASNAVNQACVRGLIDCSLSNPQFSSILNRATGYQMLTRGFNSWNAASRGPFRDVSGQWYEAAANSAYTLGWTTNRGGLFLGAENFTRAQMAVAVTAVLGLTAGSSSALNSYNDRTSVPPWASGQMAAMVSAGLMGQGGNTHLRPNDPINKLEAIVVLNSAITYANSHNIDVLAVAATRLGVTRVVLQNALNSGLNIVNGTTTVPSPFPNFFYVMRTSWPNPAIDNFQLNAVRDLGMQYVQGTPSFFWGNGESGPNGDVMKWGEFDSHMDMLALRELKVIAMLQTPKLAGLHWNQSIQRTDPRYREEYGEYAYEFVNRYKNHPAWSGLIAIWGGSSDVWGESSFGEPEVVIPLLNAAYDGVKRADPSTIVIGFNMATTFTTGADWEQWHTRAFNLSPRFDWFGVQSHDIPVGVTRADNQYIGLTGLSNVRRFLDERGFGNKPLWLNEGGFSIFNSGFNERSAAEQAVETFVAARTLNINLKGWVYFDMFGIQSSSGTTTRGCGPTDDGDNWGIMTCAVLPNMPQPRDAYRALQRLFNTINFPAYNYESTLSGTPNQSAPFVYKFSKANNPASKLWVLFSPRIGGQPVNQDVTINIAPAAQATKIEMLGSQTVLQANANGNITVQSGSAPVYVKVGN